MKCLLYLLVFIIGTFAVNSIVEHDLFSSGIKYMD